MQYVLAHITCKSGTGLRHVLQHARNPEFSVFKQGAILRNPELRPGTVQCAVHKPVHEQEGRTLRNDVGDSYAAEVRHFQKS